MADGARGDVQAEDKRILDESGVKTGFAVHLGCGDGRLMAELHAGDRLVVHGLDPSPQAVAAARGLLQARGLHGRMTVERLSGARLPYVDNLVNLIVVHDRSLVAREELLRVLRPGGAAVFVTHDGQPTTEKAVKPWPADMDEWTHFLHGPDNNAVSKDLRVGPPTRIQWTAGPRWARSHEITPSIQGVVGSAGRLFYVWDQAPIGIFDTRFPEKWALIARDAFNGALLWQRPIPGWAKDIGWLGYPASANARMAVVGDRVYVGLGGGKPVTAYAADTGEPLRTFEGTEQSQSLALHQGVLVVLIGSGATKAKDGAGSSLAAFDAQTGKTLWKITDSGMKWPAMSGDAVYYLAGKDAVCADLGAGAGRWRVPVDGKMLVVHDDLVLVQASDRLTALAARDGATRWQYAGGDRSLFAGDNQVFVAGGLVWPHVAGTGLDPLSGEVKRKIQTDQTAGHHDRCHLRKATERFLIASHRGAEFFDLSGREPARVHDWVRGTCRLGLVPANGLLYAPSHACHCYFGTKLMGFNALASGDGDADLTADPETVRCEQALPAAAAAKSWGPCDAGADWPLYRRDAARSGATEAALPPDLAPDWVCDFKGRLTPPVAAAGKVFVATPDTCEVHAVEAAGGKRLWSFAAGAAVDSPPAIVSRPDEPTSVLCVFGCRDGRVYAVRAADGTLAWRSRVAPRDRLVASEGRIESAWPVHGSILVQSGTIYAVAGRSSFLDGGLWICGLDPGSGRMTYQNRLYDQGSKPKFEAHDAVVGALNDILVGTGTGFRLSRLVLEPEKGESQGRSLFATSGFLDDSFFNRAWWALAQDFPRYTRNPLNGPRGQMLVFNPRTVFGVRVFRHVSKWGGRSADFYPGEGYEVFATVNANFVPGPWKEPAKGPVLPLSGSDVDTWKTNLPVRVRGMVLAGGRLFVAGAPDRLDAADPLQSLEERGEGLLYSLAAVDGTKQAEWKLDAPPVFDGLITAQGRLYLCDRKGRLVNFAARSRHQDTAATQ